MNAPNLASWLSEKDANSAFAELCSDLLHLVPPDCDFNSDIWNVVPWLTKVGTKKRSNVYFKRIRHHELRLVCKLWLLHGRLTSIISSRASIELRLTAFVALSHVIGRRQFITLKTDDFNAAERWICGKYGHGTAFRRAGGLQSASYWLSVTFNLRLDYKNRLVNPAVHGRYGTDEGREEKLLPSEVLRDMLQARHRDDITIRDRFFLSVFAITIAAGFRVGELATLPANCLLRINGKLHVLHHPAKGGKPVPRPIHPQLADLVEDAIKNLIAATHEARESARQVRLNPRLDWTLVLDDRAAFRYFTAQWAHEWTKAPTNLMINPDGAWYTKEQRFIDAIGAYEANGNNKSRAAKMLGLSRVTFTDLLNAQEAARRGKLPPVRNVKRRGQTRSNWDTDLRVLSILQLEKHCNRVLNEARRALVRDIVEEAQAMQLRGKVYPAPTIDKKLEEAFLRQIRPILKDKMGNAILYQDQALLITQKYALSEQRSTKGNDFTSLSSSSIMRWLTGETRSRGTRNNEDSVFNRLGINDPRTGETAKFTTHDIRHWLNTLYQNGGLTEDQIALIFNRRYKQQNALYDQTTSTARRARLKGAIRNQIAVGQVAETYKGLADFSRDDAEAYLQAVCRMVNPMPHGVCLLDWATMPCPHHLSCFSCDDEKPCEHLVVEPRHESSIKELKRIQRESELIISALASQGVDDSPTLDHFKRVLRNIDTTLDRIHQISTEGTPDERFS